MGFSVSQVVHDYGGLCQAITELAVERKAAIGAEEFQILNGCLDDAIAEAVTEFGRLREQTVSEKGVENLGAGWARGAVNGASSQASVTVLSA